MAKNEVAVYDRTKFAVLESGTSDIAQILNENLGGEELKPSDLERIKVPSGGGTFWTINDEPAKSFDGVIVGNVMGRSYWKSKFTGDNVPPDCISTDLINGNGDPGGSCKECPFGQFGSGENGVGQACKTKRTLFIIQPDGESILPVILSVPTGSLGNARKYLLKLAQSKKRATSVVTRFSLKTSKNATGIDYSEIVFEKLGDIKEPEAMEAYAKSLEGFIRKAEFVSAADEEAEDKQAA